MERPFAEDTTEDIQADLDSMVKNGNLEHYGMAMAAMHELQYRGEPLPECCNSNLFAHTPYGQVNPDVAKALIEDFNGRT